MAKNVRILVAFPMSFISILLVLASIFFYKQCMDKSLRCLTPLVLVAAGVTLMGYTFWAFTQDSSARA